MQKLFKKPARLTVKLEEEEKEEFLSCVERHYKCKSSDMLRKLVNDFIKRAHALDKYNKNTRLKIVNNQKAR